MGPSKKGCAANGWSLPLPERLWRDGAQGCVCGDRCKGQDGQAETMVTC